MQTESTRTLNIFLGSPNDLAREREIAEKTINRFNKVYGRHHGVRLELLRWEDLPAGRGRPQEQINKILEAADLFIGLLWKHWGTPTGKYSSGFEEEFEIASSLGREMWLFFKKIPEETLKEQAPGLQKIVEFRQKLVEAKNLIFKEFEEQEWEQIIFDDLIKYCGKLRQAVDADVSPPVGHAPIQLPGGLGKSTRQKKRKRKSDLIAGLVAATKEKDKAALNLPTKARLYSISASLLYNSELQTEVLNTHQINLLYRHHRGQKLTGPETYLILRTIIADTHGSKPGWVWLDWMPKAPPEDVLIFVAENAGFDDLRANALSLYGKVTRRPKLERIEPFLDSQEEKVVKTTLEIFARSGTKREIPAIERVLRTRPGGLAKEAWSAKYEILVREDSSAALSLVDKTPKDERGSFLPSFGKLLDTVPSDHVRAAKNLLSDPSEDVRLRLVERLAKDLSAEELEGQLADGSFAVRGAIFLEVIRRKLPLSASRVEKSFRGESTPTLLSSSLFGRNRHEEKYREDNVLLELFRTKSEEELKVSVGWLKPGAEIAYRVLVEKHFTSNQALIREDIKKNFERLRQDHFTAIGVSLTDSATRSKPEKLDPFIKSQFLRHTTAALRHVESSDSLDLAKLLLTQPQGYFKSEIASDLLPVFKKYGTEADTNLVLGLIPELWATNKAKAVYVVLDLAKDKAVAVELLLARKEDSVTEAILKYAAKKKKLLKKNRAFEFLFHESDGVRLTALAHLLITWGKKGSADLLSDILSRERYYYNVVCELDRVIYAPKAFQMFYGEELQHRLNSSEA